MWYHNYFQRKLEYSIPMYYIRVKIYIKKEILKWFNHIKQSLFVNVKLIVYDISNALSKKQKKKK